MLLVLQPIPLHQCQCRALMLSEHRWPGQQLHSHSWAMWQLRVSCLDLILYWLRLTLATWLFLVRTPPVWVARSSESDIQMWQLTRTLIWRTRCLVWCSLPARSLSSTCLPTWHCRVYRVICSRAWSTVHFSRACCRQPVAPHCCPQPTSSRPYVMLACCHHWARPPLTPRSHPVFIPPSLRLPRHRPTPPVILGLLARPWVQRIPLLLLIHTTSPTICIISVSIRHRDRGIGEIEQSSLRPLCMYVSCVYMYIDKCFAEFCDMAAKFVSV